jgi:lysozyme
MSTTAITPKARPQLPEDRIREVVDRILRENPNSDSDAIKEACPVKILAVRGYYRNTLGRLGVNDVGVFDDAGFVVTPDRVARFNWNCDPSKIGWNPGVDKFYAQLMPGVWPYREGPHRGKPGALRQLSNEDAAQAELERFFSDDRSDGYFQVRRVEKENVGKLEFKYQAINLHWGGKHGTNSWGCQTVPEPQWDEFHDAIYSALDGHGQQWDPKNNRFGWVPYLLTEEKLA